MSEGEQKERKKYEKIWAKSEYRKAASPGLMILKSLPIEHWLEEYGVESVLDAGCGSGRFLRRLRRLMPDVELSGIDIAENAPHDSIRDCFTRGALWDTSSYTAVGAIFCVDVMEHIPENYIDRVLSNFTQFARKFVVLSICLVPDNFGYLVDEPLHLTVKDSFWWFDKFKQHDFKLKFCLTDGRLLQVLLVPA